MTGTPMAFFEAERYGFDEFTSRADQNPDNYYKTLASSLVQSPPLVAELRAGRRVVQYLVEHPSQDDYSRAYLAAHWEYAVRLRDRLDGLRPIELVDQSIPPQPSTPSVDASIRVG